MSSGGVLMALSRTKKPKRLNPIFSSVDVGILMFLWKHRVATFEALRTLFYSDLLPEQAYYKLKRLRLGEYIEVQKLEGTQNSVWILGLRGYRYLVGNCLPELKSKTYKPQSPYHDLLAASALIGRWKLTPPENVSVVTEQELLTTDLCSLPKDFRNDPGYRPDGLWVFNQGKESFAIALEVELSGKSSERYERICVYYTCQHFLKHIVWIVENKTLARRILAGSRRYGIPREGIHLFIEKEDFIKHEWDAKIVNESMKGKTLFELLSSEAKVKMHDTHQACIRLDHTSNTHDLEGRAQNVFLNSSIKLKILDTLRKKSFAKVS